MRMARFYTINELVQFDEDLTHEFKGHCNLSFEEVPGWATLNDNPERKTRQAISRAICAFLNSPRGGTIYCGIVDSGNVKGLIKTVYQKDHFTVSLQDLLDRYKPPVPNHRVTAEFIPVVDSGLSSEQIQEAIDYVDNLPSDPDLRKRPHQLRGDSCKCWCHIDAKAKTASGGEAPLFVIEIRVHPWNSEDPRNENLAIGQMKAAPVHIEETGRAYFRRQASVVAYNPQEIQVNATKVVDEFYQAKKDKMLKEMADLRKQLDELSTDQAVASDEENEN